VTGKQEVTLVGICEGCGTDVRADSLFCYNCGAKVVAGGAKSAPTELLKPGRNGASAEATDSIVDSTSVPRVSNERRRRERKRVNVVWERTDGPGYLVLLFAIIVAVIVILLLAAAGYLQ
jgi:hypothetical protein